MVVIIGCFGLLTRIKEKQVHAQRKIIKKDGLCVSQDIKKQIKKGSQNSYLIGRKGVKNKAGIEPDQLPLNDQLSITPGIIDQLSQERKKQTAQAKKQVKTQKSQLEKGAASNVQGSAL